MIFNQDYLKLHFIVWIWGFTAILGLLITIPSVEIVFYRTLLASLAMGVILFYRKTSIQIGPREIIKILGVGFIIAGHWILFFASARVSTASVCLAGMATITLWTSFLEPAINRTKIKGFEVVLGLVVMVGLYVIFRFEFDHALGLTMAVISAILSALFSVINGRLTKVHNPNVITFYEMIGACVGCAVFFPIYQAYFTEGAGLQLVPEPMDWLWLFVLATVCTVYAFTVSVEIMKRISAFAVNLTVNLEPVYGIILAVLIFGDKEKMGGGFYLGTFIILISVLTYPLLNKRFRKKPLATDNLR